MLKELMKNGYPDEYNCAEKIIKGANEAYRLGLEEDSTRLFAAFGGGLAIGDTCGAVCSALGVISRLFVADTARKSELLKLIICDFMKRFQEKTGSLKCAELKKQYAANGQKCAYILESAGEILDQIIEKYADYIIEAYRQDLSSQPECSPPDRRIG